jgi:hypothetical protein
VNVSVLDVMGTAPARAMFRSSPTISPLKVTLPLPFGPTLRLEHVVVMVGRVGHAAMVNEPVSVPGESAGAKLLNS